MCVFFCPETPITQEPALLGASEFLTSSTHFIHVYQDLVPRHETAILQKAKRSGALSVLGKGLIWGLHVWGPIIGP